MESRSGIYNYLVVKTVQSFKSKLDFCSYAILKRRFLNTVTDDFDK